MLRLALYPILYFISVAGTLPPGIKWPEREANIDLHLVPSEVCVFMSVRKYAQARIYLNMSHLFPKFIDRIIKLLTWFLMSAETSNAFLIFLSPSTEIPEKHLQFIHHDSFRTLSS